MDAYAGLVRASEGAARRLAFLLCGAVDGDDAVQEAIVKGWYALPRYRGDSSFRTWLLRIVANEAHNRRRSTTRRSVRELRVHEESAVDSPESAALVADQRRRVAAAVDALPDKLRDVVACRHLLELSEAETAAVLGVPAGTVKSRLSRGLEQLRAVLEVSDD